MAMFKVPNVRQQMSSFKCHFSGFTWRLWYAVALFGTMGVARGMSCRINIYASADQESTGIEEALVGTMVEQLSFIEDFGLSTMNDDQRAETVGNIVSISQLGCIAGALS